MAINQSEDSSLLDPSFSPLLLFDYDYYQPRGDNIDDDLHCEPDDEDHVEIENNDCNNDDNREADNTFFFYSITKRFPLRKRVDYLKNHNYWTTPQGWMLMSHSDSHDTFLWNPFTGQRIDLPLDDDDFLAESQCRCFLSHRPTDPDCMVLVVNINDTILWYCHPGGKKWFTHMYDYTGGNQWFAPYMHDVLTPDEIRCAAITSMACLTAVGGKFYAHFTHRIVTLEFLPNPTFTCIPVEEASDAGYMYTASSSTYLESCGELFRLIMNHPTVCDLKVSQIEVQKLDLSTRAWVKVDTLDDMVFFDVSGCRVSLSAKQVGLKGNCIYFVRCHDKGLYVYDMERGTTAVHDPGQDLPDDMTPDIVVPPY